MRSVVASVECPKCQGGGFIAPVNGKPAWIEWVRLPKELRPIEPRGPEPCPICRGTGRVKKFVTVA